MPKRDEQIGITSYGSRELTSGVTSLIEDAYNDGFSIITKYGHPVAWVLPVSINGIKKLYEKIILMMDEVQTEEKEFKDFKNAMIGMMEKIK